MAVYRTGSSGTGVTSLQELLKSAGFDPGPIDGVYGPKTYAAVLAYQQSVGITADGIAGPQTLGELGGVTSGTSGGGTDYTDDEETRFIGLPARPEIWKDSTTGESFIVYYVPGTEPPLPTLYRVPVDADLEALTGNKTVDYDKIITTEQITSTGALIVGTSTEIPRTEGDPTDEFVLMVEESSAMQPWLKDPQVLAVYFNAYLENRPIEDWELFKTKYWQDASDAERDWMRDSAQNPATAADRRDDAYITAYNSFLSLGVDNPPEDVLRFLGDKFVMGHWTQAYLLDQIEAITGGASANPLDDELESFMEDGGFTIDTPALKITEVENLFRTWLGPGYPPTSGQVGEWASKLRRNPEAGRDQLIQMLQGQRMALFPEYKDETLSYEDIASPWRSFASNLWGQAPDETEAMFQDIVKMNDTTEAGKLLRTEGLKQNIGKVEQDFSQSNIQQFGGLLQRAK